jgi:5-methylcytosine-specific restriction endonuclease McrA
MIRRYTPIRKKRSKPRRGQATKEEKNAIRLAVYERAQGQCELRILGTCIRGQLSYSGDTPWDHGHLVHLKSLGSGGKWSMENCRWGCHICHLEGIHRLGMKPEQ